MKLEEIATNPHFVLPGNALGSRLFTQIVNKKMPYDVEYEGETKFDPVTPDELKALEAWIVVAAQQARSECNMSATAT